MFPKREKKKEVVTATAEAVGKQGNTVSILASSPGLSALRVREKEKESASIPFPEAHIFREQHTTFFAPQFMYQYDAESML